MLHAGFFQRSADKGDVVGSTAAASRLGHDDGHVIQVVLSGKQRLHDLSYHHQGGIAGVVVHVLQTHVNGFLIVIGQHFQMIAGSVESRRQKIEVDWRHLRTENGMGLAHLFGKGRLLDGRRFNGSVQTHFFSGADSGQKGTDTDPRCTQIVDLVNL